MRLSLIVAVDENSGIGIDGNQPAFISEDLKRFKKLTTGNAIVMGRKTFEALPKGALPNRRNIVITRQKDFSPPGCEVIHSGDELHEVCSPEESVFVIGGGEVYKLFFSDAIRIYLTLIHYKFPGIDTCFPPIKEDEWVVERSEGPYNDEKSGFSYSYINYVRRR
jgi:dihydrofolate reductase